MSVRSDVLLWAQRVVARGSAPAHQLLELPATATLEQAQETFHKIARTAHPDLHRTSLTPEELELVTTAYARVAGAYQEMRSQRAQTTRMRPIKLDGSDVPAMPVRPPTRTPTQGSQPIPRPGDPASGQMNSKAMIYYRKAELSLRKGEVKTALLQLKMAIAADPQSTFLRTALTEVEAELAKKP